MNTFDQIFGWLMIACGVTQSVTNFRIQSASHLTLSLSGTAAAIIVSGFLNVSRAGNCGHNHHRAVVCRAGVRGPHLEFAEPV